MASAYEIRKENLRRLILDRFDGNNSALARAVGVHPNQINLLTTNNETYLRNLTEAAARRFEVALELPEGWFDEERSGIAAAASVVIKPMAVPAELAHIFRAEDQLQSIAYLESALQVLSGRISSVHNLALARLSTTDLAPEIPVEAHVVVDTAVKAITTDGIYVLQRGNDTFLRKVTRRLTGTWMVSSGSESTEIESLKGIKAAGRVVMHADLQIK